MYWHFDLLFLVGQKFKLPRDLNIKTFNRGGGGWEGAERKWNDPSLTASLILQSLVLFYLFYK